ncbi:uncharacterized protein HMPREF1541_02582 [Cyphellophora europaea CBS 101466]|uniref:SnoaL-like domain-containing protein n=1 Tax=Cyphellophora europaea (strain CBS 101466) TaxID=1220924 RepID=W2S5X6_CYPE1|nr:uncharacterized protein HMPREF1541_02582 [Cyphellophora europaea CBS 101466]ETN43423.1 hypothetical protein HMPREF1541_02582 [Cyphellophora europaea CBS 101466]
MPVSSDRVRDIFSNLSSPETSARYWEHVSSTVHWTVMGSTPISGVYNSKKAFVDATVSYLGRDVLTAPLRIQPVNVITSVVENGKTTAVVEMKAIDAECQNGMEYDMRYCWICKFDDASETIEEVRAYLDTDLLRRVIAENTGPS